jgi:hypothetical protein
MLSRIYPGAEGYAFLQGLSLVLFFAVFIGVILVTITMRRSHSDKMSQMPLELENNKNIHNGGHE